MGHSYFIICDAGGVLQIYLPQAWFTCLRHGLPASGMVYLLALGV